MKIKSTQLFIQLISNITFNQNPHQINKYGPNMILTRCIP